MDELKRFIIERTQGNPFFIEEIVQALFDEGVLVRNGTIKVAGRSSQVHLPPTVQGILAARIDRLPAAEKELLQTLAVIGREFPLGLIRRRDADARRRAGADTRQSATWRVHIRTAGLSRASSTSSSMR